MIGFIMDEKKVCVCVCVVGFLSDGACVLGGGWDGVGSDHKTNNIILLLTSYYLNQYIDLFITFMHLVPCLAEAISIAHLNFIYIIDSRETCKCKLIWILKNHIFFCNIDAYQQKVLWHLDINI